MPRRRLFALVAVLAAGAAWLPLHPVQPPLAGGDVYTHLGTARELARGHGYRCEFVYPLSLAFPFARSVPQPLIHRPPLYATLLVGAYWAAGGDPQGTLDGARRVLGAALLLTALAGALALAKDRERWPATAPWLVFLLAQPLLALLVHWGREEVLAGLVLLLVWLALRRGDAPHARPRRAVLTGMLTGAVALLRPELAWIPVLWWLGLPAVTGGGPRAATASGARRRLGLFLGVALLVCLPWLVRNLLVTGNPIFSLQAHAEHLKYTPSWPSFSVYRQLDVPPGFLASLVRNPVELGGKAVLGTLFLLTQADEFLPWILWPIVLAALAWQIRRRRRRGAGWLAAAGPAGLALATFLVVLVGLTFFSVSTRHPAPLVPVLLWEVCRLLDRTLARRVTVPAARLGALAALAGLVLLATPPRLDGWNELLVQARAERPRVDAAVARLRTLPPGPIFSDASAVMWYADRAGVWAPVDPPTEAWIRSHVAGMADAPSVLIAVAGEPDPTGGGLAPSPEDAP